MSLEAMLKNSIQTEGPMSVASYMALCLMHPVYGYYQTQDAIGAKGDFITAPEVSKLFGDVLGLWLGQLWLDLGSPPIDLVELGPGRGTLMADLLRTAGCFKGFNKATEVTLVEKSQRLMRQQQQKLKDISLNISWTDSLPSHVSRTPLIMANEFLDALPICQYIYLNGAWRERMVGLDKHGFAFVASPQTVDPALLPNWLAEQPPEEGDILELSPAIDSMVDQICSLILQGRGAACLIDYGYRHHAYGDSFQALRDHEFVDVFDTPGSADLTAHVNFARIVEIAEERGLTVYGTVTQGDFLRGMSIEHLAILMMQQAEANNVATSPIKWGLERLVDPAQMGDLFKVVILMHPDGPTPKPFVGDHD